MTLLPHSHTNILLLAPCAFFLALGSLAHANETTPRSALPNVVVILVDDMGYADIGPFGCTKYATPNFDRLAREGRKFTNFHVSQPVCSASRCALLTGCYSNRLGIHGALMPDADYGLNSNEVTLARVFKNQGYATGMAGKWHLGHHREFLPLSYGFDEYFGLAYSNDMWPHNASVKPGTFSKLPLIENDTVAEPDVTPEMQANLTTWYTERAVRFIERNHDRPFFFYLAHSMPHVPLFVSDKFKNKSGAGLYGDVISEIDWSVGQVLDTLERNRLAQNTFIIFMSDNGPWLAYGNHAGSAGPLREGKLTAWEGGTRVPCLMRWPAQLAAGTASDAMLMTIDLLPTLAKRIGAPLPPQPIDGLDVWSLLRGEPNARNPHSAYFTWCQKNELHAITTADGRWKLQFPHAYPTLNGRPGGKDGIRANYETNTLPIPELYYLKGDVSESKNIAAEHPEIVKELLSLAETARDDLGDALTHRQGKGIREPGRLTTR